MKLRNFLKRLTDLGCEPRLREGRKKGKYLVGDHISYRRVLSDGKILYTGFSMYPEITVSVIKDVLGDLEITRDEWLGVI